MKSHRLNLTAAALAGALLMTNCGEDAPRTNPAGPSMIEPPASTAPGTATQTAAPVGGHARRMPQAPAGVQPVSIAPAIDLTNLPEGVSAADAARWMRERNALVMNASGGRPGPVRNLRASTVLLGGTEYNLRLQWDQPRDTGDSTITGYKLEVEDLTGTIVSSHSSRSTGWLLRNLPFGEYLSWVAAVNSRGTGQWSLLIYEYEAETLQAPGRVRDLRAGDTNPPEATCEESAANGCVRNVRATWSAPNSGGTPSEYVIKVVNLSLPRAERPDELILRIPRTSFTESLGLGSGEWLIEVRAENDAGTGEPQHTTFIVTGPFNGDSTPWSTEDAKVTQLDSRGHRWRMTWNPPAMPTSAPWKSPVIRYRIVTGIKCSGRYPHHREIRLYQINDRNRNNTPYEAAFSAVPGPQPEGIGTGFTIYAENAAGIGFCTPAVVVPR